MELVGYVIFPDYSDVPSWTNGEEAIHTILAEQLATIAEIDNPAEVASDFVDALPQISQLLHSDTYAAQRPCGEKHAGGDFVLSRGESDDTLPGCPSTASARRARHSTDHHRDGAL